MREPDSRPVPRSVITGLHTFLTEEGPSGVWEGSLASLLQGADAGQVGRGWREEAERSQRLVPTRRARGVRRGAWGAGGLGSWSRQSHC